MTYQTPCSDPANDPDDWFLGRDGRQYVDEDLLTDAEVHGLKRSVLPISGETTEQHVARVDLAIRQAENARKRKNLTARRHAREACFGCYFRTNCLDQALAEGHTDGTWGGYFEEQLREIRKEISRKQRNA